jgi:hypothetical protein
VRVYHAELDAGESMDRWNQLVFFVATMLVMAVAMGIAAV